MSSAVQTQQPVLDHGTDASATEIIIYSHTGLFYWWPVWALGFVAALLTCLEGDPYTFGNATVIIHSSKNLGVIFTVVVVLVILMTNVSVRGVSSLTVIVAILGMTFFFAYMGWWDDIFRALSW